MIMFWPSSASVRLPSSSVGRPNIAGSGAGLVGVLGGDRPLVAHERDELRHARPRTRCAGTCRGRRAQAASAASRSGRIDASGGSCATSVRTSSGCVATRASAFTAPPLLANRSTGPAPSVGDDPMQVVGVLLGRRLAGRIGLRAAFDAARVVGDDGAIGEVAGRACRTRRRPSASRSAAAPARCVESAPRTS